MSENLTTRRQTANGGPPFLPPNLQSLVSSLIPFAFALALLFLVSCAPAAEFDANRPDPETPGAMARQPAAVSFIELDANPQLYRNRLVRVTGAYSPLPEAPCEPYKGPPATWALVDEGLRLDVQGFARVMELVPEGTLVTVDGFWQRYRGPVGCGKEPPTETLWYLRAVRLVQPNPLPELAGLPPEPSAAQEATPTPQSGDTPDVTSTPTATTTATPSPTPSATPTLDLTASPTATSDAEATPSATPTATPTEDADTTPTPSPTADPGATLTPTPENGGEPGPTSTPSDYPGPPPPPDATDTPDPYG